MTDGEKIILLKNFTAQYNYVATMSKGDRKRFCEAAEKQTTRFECDTTMNRALALSKK